MADRLMKSFELTCPICGKSTKYYPYWGQLDCCNEQIVAAFAQSGMWPELFNIQVIAQGRLNGLVVVQVVGGHSSTVRLSVSCGPDLLHKVEWEICADWMVVRHVNDGMCPVCGCDASMGGAHDTNCPFYGWQIVWDGGWASIPTSEDN